MFSTVLRASYRTPRLMIKALSAFSAACWAAASCIIVSWIHILYIQYGGPVPSL